MNPNIIARSSYSFFQSLLSVEDIINFAIDNGFKEVALVEKDIFYSAFEFYKLAKKNNLKAVIGLEFSYQGQTKIAFAKNYQGYQKLIIISSKINLGEELSSKDFDQNLLFISADQFPINCYFDNDLVYLEKFSTINNLKLNGNLEKLFTKEEFIEKYGFEIYQKLSAIYQQIDLKIKPLKSALPVLFEEDFKKILFSKLSSYLQLNPKLNHDQYNNRLKYEIDIIEKMNISKYFLIVADFVRFAKEAKIMIGPGRGSAPGSLVVFLLGITSIDPLKFNLLFERFLNPKRINLPDIDIDFEDTRREEIFFYLHKKYGHLKVATIITFQSYKAKSALKDALRLNEVSPIESNKLTKLIDERLNLKANFEHSNNKFRYAILNNSNFKKSLDFAYKIENLKRQFSTHAAGIVLSSKEIFKFVPVQSGYNQNLLQTQYSMEYLEENGLIKIDILGLRNLNFLQNILNLVKLIYKKTINLEKIDLNDQKVYQLFQEGKTMGIFQFESSGMISLLKKLKPNHFEDLVSAVSLFRPGPLKEIDHFIDRKFGREKISYIVPQFEKILKSTYGVIVYQEQIMEIVRQFSGFSLVEADIFRMAIGKKDLLILRNLKTQFEVGAKNNNYSSSQIREVYQLIEKFSNYGFNRSHAVAYAILSFQIAWLKTYYPTEFMIALLNSIFGNLEKTKLYIQEGKKMGLAFLPPAINHPSSNCAIVDNEKIRIGMKAVKGIGESTIKQIKNELKNGEFKSYQDFILRISLTSISKSNVKILIKSGALDEFNLTKTTMLKNLEALFDYANLITINSKGQKKLDFDLAPPPVIKNYLEINSNFYQQESLGFILNAEEVLMKFEKYFHSLKNWKKINDIKKDRSIPKNYFCAGILLKWEQRRNFNKGVIEDQSGRISFLWRNDLKKQISSTKLLIGGIYLLYGSYNIEKEQFLVKMVKSIEENKLLKGENNE